MSMDIKPEQDSSAQPQKQPSAEQASTGIDPEWQAHTACTADDEVPQSVYKSLGWLDRLLALWILLAMAVGILLGNFVESVEPALEKGEFVGVEVPIGT
jgi:arsenite transporter